MPPERNPKRHHGTGTFSGLFATLACSSHFHTPELTMSLSFVMLLVMIKPSLRRLMEMMEQYNTSRCA